MHCSVWPREKDQRAGGENGARGESLQSGPTMQSEGRSSQCKEFIEASSLKLGKSHYSLVILAT